MNFSINHTKIKASWFDTKNSKIKKIGTKAFYLYLTLYRYYIRNQEETMFVTSIYNLA